MGDYYQEHCTQHDWKASGLYLAMSVPVVKGELVYGTEIVCGPSRTPEVEVCQICGVLRIKTGGAS